MIFGSHVSIRDGYLGAAKRAVSLNADAFQYFPKNPRSLSVKTHSQEDAALCKDFCDQKGLVSVAHTPYPTTLTPSDEHKREQVTESLLNDLAIADACGSLGVVVHFGKDIFKGDQLASYRLMIGVLNEVLSQWLGECRILLENMAGKPGTMGTTLEELAQLRRLSDHPEKIGFCLDTCHAFASGLWSGDNWKEVVKKGEELDYFAHLAVIHLNNSKYDTGSGKDRHANIFDHGYIKENQFDQLMDSPLLENIPFILETPKEIVSHKEEIRQLQQKWGKK
ncbi:putative endonuclease 4 [Halobacillus andaensis]|uniref:Endonuclease 4 n=1 Tax=Halobacillus andaensis TaxID=1176239 RepID=A0A917EWQ9_HALAA|nr:deoxyribonuclease IV [Halobacillus andaensis]MBP2006476.1 deoxyribonuclease-4 [Halobacillus andaensis]GGF27650.1 putative endonuclease 4 [Halobacillus andaensis]